MSQWSPKHILYIILGLVGLVTCWMHGIAWMAAGGNILNLYAFFHDAYASGEAAAFLTIDIAIVWATFLIWVVGDARKIGLGARLGSLFFGLSFLGTCFAFPLYLVARERHLARVGRAA